MAIVSFRKLFLCSQCSKEEDVIDYFKISILICDKKGYIWRMQQCNSGSVNYRRSQQSKMIIFGKFTHHFVINFLLFFILSIYRKKLSLHL